MSCDARVDLFASAAISSRSQLARCAPIAAKLYSALGGRVVAQEARLSDGQGAGMRMALDLFKRSVVAVSNYSLIVIVRHDFIFTTPISRWRGANLARFNFISRCERSCQHRGPDSQCCSHNISPADAESPNCVADHLHTMPGRFFDAFDSVAGQSNHGCFISARQHPNEHGNGHRTCGRLVPQQIEQRAHVNLSESWGFLTDWQPTGGRARNC